MREIIITVSDENSLDVREGDRYCNGLSWDEMLGQIAAMTVPLDRVNAIKGLYPMLTKQEWDERDRLLKSRINEVNILEKTA